MLTLALTLALTLSLALSLALALALTLAKARSSTASSTPAARTRGGPSVRPTAPPRPTRARPSGCWPSSGRSWRPPRAPPRRPRPSRSSIAVASPGRGCGRAWGAISHEEKREVWCARDAISGVGASPHASCVPQAVQGSRWGQGRRRVGRRASLIDRSCRRGDFSGSLASRVFCQIMSSNFVISN